MLGRAAEAAEKMAWAKEAWRHADVPLATPCAQLASGPSSHHGGAVPAKTDDTDPAKGEGVFDHPAGWHTKADIARIWSQIASGAEPWATALAALMNNSGVAGGGYKLSPVAVVHLMVRRGSSPPGLPLLGVSRPASLTKRMLRTCR